MTELQRLMGELDAALTGKSFQEATAQFHHYPHTLEKWLEEDSGNLVWYLSDHGYSRLYYSTDSGTLLLTHNSTDKVKSRWEIAQAQRQAAQNYITAEFERISKEFGF